MGVGCRAGQVCSCTRARVCVQGTWSREEGVLAKNSNSTNREEERGGGRGTPNTKSTPPHASTPHYTLSPPALRRHKQAHAQAAEACLGSGDIPEARCTDPCPI